jgi:uncharacterized damage-inducible protein DinB
MNGESPAVRDQIRAELEAARREFHAALATLSDVAWGQPSANAGWTNGQLLFHITFAFILVASLLQILRLFGRLPPPVSRVFAGLLDLSTVLFNRMNALGPRVGARVYDRDTLARRYDRVHRSLRGKLDHLRAADWQLGMYYPRRWDPRFKEYMRIGDVVRYTIHHQRHHLDQLRSTA